MKRSFGLAIGLVLALTGSALGHYTFVLPEKFRVASGEELTIGFHASDSFPESTQLPRRLQSATLHTGKQSIPLPEFRADGLRQLTTVKPPAGYSIITAENPPRSADMKADEFLQYLKEESLTGVIEARQKAGESEKVGRERYSMYLKSIVLSGKADSGYKHIVGMPIEIVPEADPSGIKAGGSLPVRVLFKGKVAPGLQIFAASAKTPATKNIGKTDRNGRVSVPVTSSGAWRLHTILMERVTLPDADWESFWATLTFEIP
jgi:uncharacterized GH25 family protein